MCLKFVYLSFYNVLLYKLYILNLNYKYNLIWLLSKFVLFLLDCDMILFGFGFLFGGIFVIYVLVWFFFYFVYYFDVVLNM